MILPIVFFIAAAAGLLSCSREEEKFSDENPAPSCPGTGYSMEFGARKLDFCHEDPQKDGIFQSASDRLSLKDGNEYISAKDQASWRGYQEKFGLPNFDGLNLSKWKEARQTVFSSNSPWSLDDEKRFSSALDYCREKGIDFKEAIRVASRIQPQDPQLPLSPTEKTYALITVCTLLNIRRGKNPFYGKNKDFIDTVLNKIEEGKLKIWAPHLSEGEQGVPGLSDPLLAQSSFAHYDTFENRIVFHRSFDLRSSRDVAVLLHELKHFHQDSLKKALSKHQTEVDAYLLAADYLLSEGVTRIADNDMLTPFLRAVRQRSQGDEEGYEKNLKEGENVVEKSWLFLDARRLERQMANGPKGDMVLNWFIKKYAITELQSPPVLSAKIERAIGDLKKEKDEKRLKLKELVRSNSSGGETMGRLYHQMVGAWAAMIHLSMIEGELQNSRTEKIFDEMSKEMTPLQLNRKIPAGHDGVD